MPFDILGSDRYCSTFTPLGEKEEDKQCPVCERVLPPAKYKCKKGTRDGVEGIIRNYKCRICETRTTSEKKGVRLQGLELEVHEIRRSQEKLKQEFVAAIQTIRSDLDRCLYENKKLKKKLLEKDHRKPMSSLADAAAAKSHLAFSDSD